MPEGRHRATPRTLLIGGALAIVAVIAVVAMLMARAGGPSSVVRTTPAFSFSVDKAIGSSSEPGVRDVDVEDRVEEVAAQAAPFLDALFTAAFLDPASRDGSYGDVWTFFADEARPSAEAAIETLTLGSLGPRFDDVRPGRGSIRARVLLGPDGITQLVAVEVTFRATASPGGDGVNDAEIKSIGEFILRPVGEGWTIVAFRVQRVDANLPVVGAPQ